MNILLTEYNRRKKKNPAYSLRAFAKALGISPGHLSQLMTEKRELTYRSALQIFPKLELPAAEEKRILARLKKEESKGSFRSRVLKSLSQDFYTDLEVTRIPAQTYLQVGHWHHDAIFNLSEVGTDLKTQIKDIAHSLKLPVTRVRQCFSDLQIAQVITVEEGVMVSKVNSYQMDGHKSEALMNQLVSAYKESQREIFEKGMSCMRPEAPYHLLTSHCFKIPKKEFRSFAQAILSFSVQLEALYKNVDSKEDAELYFFSTQTVPVTE
ncbi:hypothetical protein ACLVWU_16970 [Bdellovibrio sp. HCB290]|uniref:hypothetical protein n=1 Tax=Bdellovibrio sp. HCB290 TaxID=3394356 RepID=UPI0039B5E028